MSVAEKLNTRSRRLVIKCELWNGGVWPNSNQTLPYGCVWMKELEVYIYGWAELRQAVGNRKSQASSYRERGRDAERRFASLANSTLRLSGSSNQHPQTPNSTRPYMPVLAGRRSQCELEKVIGRWVFVRINMDSEYSQPAMPGANIGLRI